MEREQEYETPKQMLAAHPDLKPSMRAKTINWMIEVCSFRGLPPMIVKICEEFLMHRETFHLARMYFDRFLRLSAGIHKDSLQV